MRFLHAIASVRSAGGGPAEAVRTLSGALDGLGHGSEVLSLDDPADPEAAGFPLPVHALGPGRGSYRYAPAAVPWLRQHRRDYDAVLVHGLWQYHSLAVRRALHPGGAPYFVFPHGMLDPWFRRRYPLKHLKKALYWPWAEYRVLRDAQAVLFTCEEERRLAAQSFAPYRARGIVTGLGTTPPPPGTDAATFLARYPELGGARILLFMGRLHPKKGCDLLLEGYAAALAREPGWRLVYAGPDSLGTQAALAARARALGIAERVLFTGMLHGAMKWSALAAAEVFALPSHQENFGIAVAEALACGVPVLISREVNIWREIEAARAGLVEADTVAGATALLARWRALPAGEQAGMRDRARACFGEHFDIAHSARRVAEAIRQTTADAG